MTFVLILLAAVALAYANGANDNFKGVATLFGSGTTNYRRALAWATAATLLGSLTAVLLAGTLLMSFRGKGLIPDDLSTEMAYAAAVGLGAALTILLATRIGMPVSTTHGLVGALVGAAFAAGADVNWGQLGAGFFLPLLVSPLLALIATLMLYPLFRVARRKSGIGEQTCFCVGTQVVEAVPAIDNTAALQRAEQLTVTIGDTVTCENRYAGRIVGVEAATVLDRSHFLSAGVVSFARGLNDTPKIAALLLLAPQFSGLGALAVVGLAIAAGGLLSARRVAETMSNRITEMNHGQGFTANLITGIIVIGASRLGMPVSTTHVSCGSLFGIGAVTGKGKPRMIATVLAAWVTTLPVGAALGAACYWLMLMVG
jgi:PiT family inorganic phosphate transporter